MTAYYNEIDPFAAQWLRELIAQGMIAPGVVDERSIEDVRPDDLAGYTQCHFFAGIGVWSYALRLAGWPDNRPVWTGSCPCQPFSSAGAGAGFADERHLWPTWLHFVEQRRPPVIFGEQVASKSAEPWIDLVQADLEGVGYAFGCVPFPSAGVGAPHIRDRAYWVADFGGEGLSQRIGDGRIQREAVGAQSGEAVVGGGHARGLGNPGCSESPEFSGHCGKPQPKGFAEAITVSRLAHHNGDGCDAWGKSAAAAGYGNPAGAEGGDDRNGSAGPTNGFWRDADWLFCRDGKWRPVEPGTFPLVDGAPARVGRLCGYGNAINVEAARAWIETVMEAAA